MEEKDETGVDDNLINLIVGTDPSAPPVIFLLWQVNFSVKMVHKWDYVEEW